MVFCGLVGATIAGLVIDYTKLYKEVAVVTLACATFCFAWFFEVSGFSNMTFICLTTGTHIVIDTLSLSLPSPPLPRCHAYTIRH